MSASRHWRELVRSPVFGLLVIVTVALVVIRVPLLVLGDTWYNLVLGREVAAAGVITRNALTEQGFGVSVVDIQWVSHLGLYGIVKLAGLPGMVLVGATLLIGTIVSAAAVAVRRGATESRTLLVVLFALIGMASQFVLRAQSIAFPFLAFFPLVLSGDVRAPRRTTWLLLPAAILWANVHGSVLLAPVFAVLAAVARMLDAVREHRPVAGRLLVRDVVLTLSLTLAVFITPYGSDVVRYYEQTVGNPAFREYISEWYPLSFERVPAATLFVCAVVVLVVRGARTMESFTLLTIGLLSAMAIMSARYATPLALAAIGLLPVVLDEALGSRIRIEPDALLRRVSRIGVPAAAGLLLFGVPLLSHYTLNRPDGIRLSDQVAREAIPGRRLLVDEVQADRLLWYHPSLIGRVAHDVRVETLPISYLDSLGRTYARPDGRLAAAFLGGFDLVVVDRRVHEQLAIHLEHDPGYVEFGRDADVSAFLRR
ncbi:hypothetical protein [Gemmatimonas groenlandica]|uniref:Glycosyltransferase RgtA/B/C/D-like domain-containing protein n=1 Tax=Gemmatimonas groenlandica TaxID=2732249 RepID=A0A6M4IZW5_9BACT|nr:hypothetical protein [Gemmatimonas groenlandica]QJR37741.1 hypothetical protein HKW67_20550 [Gemmatimonas groenlandica]